MGIQAVAVQRSAFRGNQVFRETLTGLHGHVARHTRVHPNVLRRHLRPLCFFAVEHGHVKAPRWSIVHGRDPVMERQSNVPGIKIKPVAVQCRHSIWKKCAAES